ncbi:Voltage-gated Ion Channel (VIC) Superfamily [Phytophthora infestans T30-4]|uniref:Voltage-gated Ion Channel (VIC) Superfamily n=1 Tax=Phytophthora infestans (strain T30-4) TaxID=403677 RepID=D0P1S0_PHYIT|nr:Voltage-gated Ion Channel (VIC) Superfamily [Phytophthora infestans T30-4]EEY54708.1 Voltage-gated Ion Channel (VIC) Superfamily [Phytophthora infestans T30-4]|eukprot:XP_002895744.1 Voltage-gated Ion Channel (VIC) Superfamily [Phytophthora infestans T30-4]
MRVMPAPAASRRSSRSRRRSSVTRTPSRLTSLLLRQRARAGSSERLLRENHNAFDPSSRFIRICQQLRLAAILFELVAIPFLAAFHPETSRSQLIATYACELLFCADIYVQLNTGYYENGNVLRDAKKARRKYLSSSAFAADLVALIPLSLLLPTSITGSRSIALLEMHKLVRVWRLPALASNLDDLYARHFESLKLTKMLGFTLLLTHFVACGRFSFGYSHPAPGEEPNHWLPHAPHDGHYSTRRQYLMSLFWAFGLLTGALEGELPHYNTEFAFTIAVGLCGLTLFTSLCATFFLLSKCESGDAELAEARVHQFQHILAFHRVPVQLQTQAVDYLQRYHTQAEANDREAARRLCPSISVDIQVELLEATVALVPVFAGCDTLFIRAVTRLLELIALPGRTPLFRAGDHGDAMYIVHTGVLHTVVRGVKVRELRKGNFVGEVAVFARQPRTATVITATYCTLYRLSRIHADKLLQGYPQYAEVINQTVAAMLQKSNTTAVEPIRKDSDNHSIDNSNNFFHDNAVRPSDAIQGFYDRIPHLAGPSKPRYRWWHRLLMKRGLDAESNWRMMWIALLIAVNCYNWVLIPLLLSFSALDGLRTRWYLVMLNLLADFVLWIDIYVNLHLSFSVNSEKILAIARTAERYVYSGKLVVDACCAWPYWIFTPSKFTHPVLRIPRLISGFRMRGLIGEVAAYFRLSSKHKLMLLGVLFLMLYHIVACLYFSTTYIDGYSTGENQWLPSEDVYLQRLNSTHFQTISGVVLAAGGERVQEIRAEQYFRSLYYAANVLAAVGRMVEPSSDTEYGAALIFMLSGFFITAIVVDHVQKGFTASALEEKEFFAARARFQRFLKRQNAPLSIHVRVNSFLDFWWSCHRGAIIDELLEDLPAAIKRDVVHSICAPAMDSLELLCAGPTVSTSSEADANQESVGKTTREQVEDIFLDNLKFVLYGQGEIIYCRGDYAAGMFFLLEGQVSVVLDGEVPRHVPLGGFFGTAALQPSARDRRETRRRSNVDGFAGVGYAEQVTAVSGCIVVYISREHLQAMQSVFPALPENLRKLEQHFHEARVTQSADLRSLQPRVALGTIGLNNPTMRGALRRKQMTGLVQSIAKNLEWWQRGTAIDPDWPFVGIWEAIMLMASTVQGTSVMFYICFGAIETSSGRVFADAATVTLELLFVLDAYLHLRLGFYEYGNKVMDLAVIQRRYLRSMHFAIDMAALVPLFIINWSLPSRNLEVLNVNKILRYLKGSSQFRTLETKYVKLTTELRLLKLVYYSFLASHMFGCVWFDFAAHKSGVHIVMSGSADTSSPSFGASVWGPYESLESASRGLQYLASVFWAYGLMSNSSQGELPKTVGECLFSVITMTTGFFLFAYVVGHISDVIELQDSENRHFVAKLSSLRQLLRHFDLPPRVEEKFKNYFFFKRFHSITQEHVLERVLPPSLVVDMRMFQLQPMIVKVAFLVGMEDSVTRMLVSLFTQVLFVKDEFICHFGEEGSEMFFIYTGVLDIFIPFLSPSASTLSGSPSVFPTSATGGRVSLSGLRKVNEITAGSYFGEAALFTNTPRNAYVRANTSCILYKLSRHSLELVFLRYPEWQQKVLHIAKIQQQQQRLQRLAYEAQAPDAGGGGRRRGIKRAESRIDLANSKAENIELLFNHRRAGNGAENTPRRINSWITRRWQRPQATNPVVRWVVPRLRSLQAIGTQLAYGSEIQSSFYLQWMRLVSICTVYVAVMVPYRLTYDSLDRWNVIPVCLRVFEALCEVVFWVDIWFQFHMRTNQAAMELYEQDQLVGYKRERLAFDLAATFPLDHFVTSFLSGSSRLMLWKWLRLNRCLKVANLVYYRNEITRRSVSYELNRAQTLWLLYLLAMFWTSCAYFAVSIYDGFGTEWQNWLPSSVLEAEDPSPDLLMLRLFRGLAFAVTVFVKKSRTFVPASQINFAFAIVISFVGQLVMALMIAEMANIFLLYINNEVQFRKNHLIVERSLARWKVSTALKRRADNFLTSWWSSHAGVDYQLIFDELPASVRTEGVLAIVKEPLGLFAHHVFRPLLHDDMKGLIEGEVKTESAVVEEAGNSCQPEHGVKFQLENLTYAIAKCLRFEGYPRGENVIVEGSVCKAMYFVVRGYLLSKSVSNPEMYPVSRFRGGGYFGETGLLGHSVSLTTVTTMRACDLFVLSSDHLLQVLQSHSYFSLVLATAQLAVNQKKTAAVFVANRFKSDDYDEDIESSDSSNDDVSDDDASKSESESEHDQASDGAKLRRASQQLKRTLQGASEETMRIWEETFALFMEMLVPNGSVEAKNN